LKEAGVIKDDDLKSLYKVCDSIGDAIEDAVGKDGVLTKLFENIPILGYLPAAVHAVAGNSDHAKRAAAKCTNANIQAIIVGVAGASLGPGGGAVAAFLGGHVGGALGTLAEAGIATTINSAEVRDGCASLTAGQAVMGACIGCLNGLIGIGTSSVLAKALGKILAKVQDGIAREVTAEVLFGTIVGSIKTILGEDLDWEGKLMDMAKKKLEKAQDESSTDEAQGPPLSDTPNDPTTEQGREVVFLPGETSTWAYGCDFVGNDLSVVSSAASECGGKCLDTPECTHFSWSPNEGGSCIMKQGRVVISHAVATSYTDMICGVAGRINWQQGETSTWADHCQFGLHIDGNDHYNVQATDCGQVCLDEEGCTHFYWLVYNQGTCVTLSRPGVKLSDAYYNPDADRICGIAGKVEWSVGETSEFAFGCDFAGNDLMNVPSSGESCGQICMDTPGCTHFAWTSHNQGTCWLKKGDAQKADAMISTDKSMLCGIPLSGQIRWEIGETSTFSMGCDFVGNDLQNVPSSGEECGAKCLDTDGCTHFTWSNFNDGTCWMKQGGAQKSDAIRSDNSKLCGIAGSLTWHMGETSEYAVGCDFHGKDLADHPSKSEDCGGLCLRQDGCTHFTWTTHNGGTCWMKQGGAHKTDAFATKDDSKVCGIVGGHVGGSIQWKEGETSTWASGCDFSGNDLSSASSSGEQCGGMCQATFGCTHFSWTDLNGGTCWMKRGRVDFSDAINTRATNALCGIIPSGVATTTIPGATDIQEGGIEWKRGETSTWASACDFNGRDLSSALTSAENCGGTCQNTAGCSHFAWTTLNGGTCWMKSGNVQFSDAVRKEDLTMVCGIIPHMPGLPPTATGERPAFNPNGPLANLPVVDQSEYTDRKLVGKGWTASIYRVKSKRDGYTYAIKECHQGCVREIEVLAHLKGTRTAPELFAIGRDGRFAVMELLNGPVFSSLHRLYPGQVKYIAYHMATALQNLHKAGYLHLDLHYGNWFLSHDYKRVILIDFDGALKIRSNEAVREVDIFIMAPETKGPNPTRSEKSDVWALGLAYYGLWGARTGGYMDVKRYISENAQRAGAGNGHGEFLGNNKLHFPPNFPKEYKSLIQRMMSRNPDERPNLSEVKELVQNLPF
jgi:predicted Ser/Thr protein kinase